MGWLTKNRKKNIVKYFLKSKGDTHMKYFYCYDQKLAKHLKASGLDYITLAKNRYDDKLFSLWAKTDEFEKAITEYNNK